MSMERPTSAEETESRAKAAPAAEDRAVPLPDLCGDLSMRIDRNGTWYYRGSPIGRMALVKLFSTVLRRDKDGIYWLTTPVENGRITVEDAPFLGVELIVEGEGRNQILRVRTNVDDVVTLDATHGLRVVHDQQNAEPRPYIHVRDGLDARLVRSVFYHLVELAVADPADPATLGVWSSGTFFAIGNVDGLQDENRP